MKNRRGIVATLGFTQTLAWASTYYLPAILAVPIARDLGLSPSWIYAGLSIGLGVSAFLGPSLGRMIDRRGGRRVLCTSNVAFAVGLGLLGGSTGPVSLLLAWLVLGAAMAAGLYEPAFAALTRLYGHDSRSAITGITLIAGFASTIGWPVSTLLEHSFSWRGTCFTWAALHIAVGLPLNAWALSRALDDAPVVQPVVGAESKEQKERGDRAMRILAFMFTAAGIVSIGMATNLPRLFVATGASPAAAIAAASLGTGALKALEIGIRVRIRVRPAHSRLTQAKCYASARSQICFSDPKFRYRPRPNENCLLRIRWASSIPANVMAALPKDLKPPIAAHRRLIAR